MGLDSRTPSKGRLADSTLAKEKFSIVSVPNARPGATSLFHERWIAEILAKRSYRASSLLLTVLGDSIAPYGGGFWLSDLISLMESLGVNERLVRTAVFRLSKDSWLTSEQIGRLSYYQLTEHAIAGFDDAFDRVYSLDDQSGPNNWCMIVMGDLDQADRKRALREFTKAGFARLSPGAYIHPTVDFNSADFQLKALGIRHKCLLMRASLHHLNSPELVADYLTQWWNLDEIEQSYKVFYKSFEPLYQRLKRKKKIPEEHAFIIRTLLIHEYRQLTISSPQLPTDLLKTDWGGKQACLLAARLYRLIHEAAGKYVAKSLSDPRPVSPEDELKYLSRFGGLV